MVNSENSYFHGFDIYLLWHKLLKLFYRSSLEQTSKFLKCLEMDFTIGFLLDFI